VPNSQDPPMSPGHGPSKPSVRRDVRARRLARTGAERDAVAAALVARVPQLLDLVDRAGGPARTAPRVGGYLSLPAEPGTGPLRSALRSAGCEVLLPWLQEDRDLDWVTDEGDDAGDEGAVAGDGHADRDRLLRPSGTRLGRRAVLGCHVLLVPALAVDGTGTRLGQGGGSYDRVLARLREAATAGLVVAVLHDDELLPAGALPREPHDLPVDAVLTPAGLRRLPWVAAPAH
jgi:5-formyltetrahydrofolate cyclo-ligase